MAIEADAWQVEVLNYSKEGPDKSCASGLAAINFNKGGALGRVVVSTGEYSEKGEMHFFSGEGRHVGTDGSPGSICFELGSGDFDGDGNDDLVACERRYQLIIFNRDGKKTYEVRTGYAAYSLDVGDLDGNGRPDVVAGGRSGNIFAVRPFKGVYWNYGIPDGTKPVVEVHLADLKNDGVKSETIGACGDGYIVAVGAGGEILWSYPELGSPGDRFYAAAVGDLDGNGFEDDVVASSREGRLFRLDRSGNVLWEKKTILNVREIMIADLENDGRREILVAGHGHVAALDPAGNLIWDFPAGDAGCFYSMAAGDMDGDHIKEIVAGGQKGALYVISHKGKELWRLETYSQIGDDYGSQAAVAIRDINGDGKGDVIFVNQAGRLYGLTEGAPRPVNETKLKGIDLIPTEHAMSVTVSIDGDDNRNAGCYVEFHDGDARWQRGMDLVRVPDNPLRFTGSLLFLEKGKTYHVRAVGVDPDGVSGRPEGKMGTEDRIWPMDAGKHYWVGTENCSDKGPGSRSEPWCTLQHAQDMAEAGDTVNILPGVYYQQVDFTRSGEPGRPITFRGAGPGVYIDGSNPGLLHGKGWVERPDLGKRIYSLQLDRPPHFVAVGDPLEDGGYGRLFNADDSPDLNWADNWERFLQGWCFPNDYISRECIRHGWIYDEKGKTLYIRLPEELDPNPANHTMHINTYESSKEAVTAFKIYNQRWLNFRRLHFRHAHNGIHIKGGHHIHIADCSFAYGNRGIRARAGTSYCTFERNRFFDNNLYGFPWGVGKVGIQETGAVSGPDAPNGATGNIVRDNFIDGFVNGISVSSPNSDIYNNFVTRTNDDAFEPDTHAGKTWNLRYWNNTALHVFNGLSISPFEDLMYFVGNTIVDFQPYAIKVQSHGSWRGFKAYHNTLCSERIPPYKGRGTVFRSTQGFQDFDLRNNIMKGHSGTVEVKRDVPVGSNWFDSNLHWTADHDGFWYWKDPYKDIGRVREGLGFEKHGLEGEPRLSDPALRGPELSAQSPAIDAGQMIPGLHCPKPDDEDANQKYCLHWMGKAPDIGGYEKGVSKMPDTDGDGMDDWWEMHFQLNPLHDDSGKDPDGDGLTNIQEYEASRTGP